MKEFGANIGIASTDAAFICLGTTVAPSYTFTPATTTRSGDNVNLMAKPIAENNGTIPVGYYALAKKSQGLGFYPTTKPLTGQQGKAYLNIASSAPSFSIEIEGETTGIKVINLEENSENNGQMYDLQGRRVAEPTKGVYIVNGKKVVVK